LLAKLAESEFVRPTTAVWIVNDLAIGRKKIGSQAGFSFNELLVAMNIVAVAVLGYSLSSGDVIRRQLTSDNSTVAINLAQDKLEELQARSILTDGDLCPSGGDRGIAAKGSGAGIFDRCWKIAASPLGTDLKQLDVTVAWRDHADHQVSLSTLIFTGD
jgi:hypothetical protein